MKNNLKKLVEQFIAQSKQQMRKERHRICHLLFTQSSLKPGWINPFVIPIDLAYVRTGSHLFYIDKAKYTSQIVPISPLALKQLDNILHTHDMHDGTPRPLSFAELHAISQMTQHQAEVYPTIFVQWLMRLFFFYFKKLPSLSASEYHVIKALADFYQNLEHSPHRIFAFQDKLRLGILKIKQKQHSGLVAATLHKMMAHPELKSACELAKSQFLPPLNRFIRHYPAIVDQPLLAANDIVTTRVRAELDAARKRKPDTSCMIDQSMYALLKTRIIASRPLSRTHHSRQIINQQITCLFKEGMHYFKLNEVAYGQLLRAAMGYNKSCQHALNQLLAVPPNASKLKVITKNVLATKPNFLVVWKRFQKSLPRLLHPYAPLLAMQALPHYQEDNQLAENEIIHILLKHLLTYWFLHGKEIYREKLLPKTGLLIKLTPGFQSLVHHDCCVEKLHLGSKLFPIEEQPLWEALKKNTSIKHLDLSGIPLKKEQLIALADILCVNAHITTLTLHHCQLTDSKLTHLFSCLKVNLTLNVLDLSHNEALSFECIRPLPAILNSRSPRVVLPSILFNQNLNINGYWQQRFSAPWIPQPVIGQEDLANPYDPTDGPLFECYNLLQLQLENVFFGVKAIGSDLVNCAQASTLTYGNSGAELILNGVTAILDKMPMLGWIASGIIKHLGKAALITSQYVDQVQRNEAIKKIALKLTANDIPNVSCAIAKQLTAAYKAQLIQLPSKAESSLQSENDKTSELKAKRLRRLNNIAEKTKTIIFHQSSYTAAEKVALLMIVRILGSLQAGKIHDAAPLVPQLVSEVAKEPPLTDRLMHEVYEFFGLEILFTKTGKEWKLKEILQLPGIKVLVDIGLDHIYFSGGKTNPQLYDYRIDGLGEVVRLGLNTKEKVYYHQKELCLRHQKEVNVMDVQKKVYSETLSTLSLAAVLKPNSIDHLEEKVRILSQSNTGLKKEIEQHAGEISKLRKSNEELKNEIGQIEVKIKATIEEKIKELEGNFNHQIEEQKKVFEKKFSEQTVKINDQEGILRGASSSTSTTTASATITTHMLSSSTAVLFQPAPQALNNNPTAPAPSDQPQHSINRSP